MLFSPIRIYSYFFSELIQNDSIIQHFYRFYFQTFRINSICVSKMFGFCISVRIILLYFIPEFQNAFGTLVNWRRWCCHIHTYPFWGFNHTMVSVKCADYFVGKSAKYVIFNLPTYPCVLSWIFIFFVAKDLKFKTW